jgi:hypothetical protein
METQERFPQGLGNLAQNARFPHSHKPIIVMIQRREKNGNSNSAIKPSTESDQVQAGAASNSVPADRKIRCLRWLRCSVVEIRCLPCLQLLPLLASSSSPSLASSSSPPLPPAPPPPLPPAPPLPIDTPPLPHRHSLSARTGAPPVRGKGACSHPTGSQPKTNLLPAPIKRTPGVTEGRSTCRARSRRPHLPTLFENKPGDG